MKKEKFLVSLFIIFLTFPLLQHKFNIFPLESLKGAFREKHLPEFKTQDWFASSYQSSVEEYINDAIGFKPWFVKIKNQIEYSAFDKVNASNVIVGKNEVLFQDFYISALLGHDFLGEETIKTKVSKLKYVQDELAKNNVQFLFVIAPGKASFYPEYLPQQYEQSKKGTSNYDVIVREFNNYGVNYIDLKQFFLKQKSSSPYPLFPKCGIHWSGYGTTLAADTMFKTIERLCHKNLINFHCLPGEKTNINLKYTDNDIGDAMNLLFPIASDTLYYPTVKFEKNDSTQKINGLFIGDSFTQSFYGFYPYFQELLLPDSRYWSYNKYIYWPEEHANGQDVGTFHLYNEIKNRDIVVIVSTEQNLSNFSFDFGDRAYDLLNNPELIKLNPREYQILKVEANIKNSPEWLASVAKKALERNLPLDTMIRHDAIWILNETNGKGN
ncbi:hypothetical protein MYP_447 [Sporocytophaga myxococcoides]|uniref:AlgX/AlgJ SGNH hydrolase-like domain-containing protein n=1 Tax=Sporocytophaga myxococcoides TaxID=153721 RepID=A0A098L8P8_9BACT|nr:hypothetical protein [Sporocytophaga myxococcoides]GAL83221.1 hypothetical protein MYP_447 [Sporocytophaga myxococcoides]